MKNYRSRGQSGNAAVVVVIVLFLAVVIGVIVYTGQPRREDSGQTLSLAAVERGDFEAFITEPGEVNSSSNVEIRCRVKSYGGAGNAIRKICSIYLGFAALVVAASRTIRDVTDFGGGL